MSENMPPVMHPVVLELSNWKNWYCSIFHTASGIQSVNILFTLTL